MYRASRSPKRSKSHRLRQSPKQSRKILLRRNCFPNPCSKLGRSRRREIPEKKSNNRKSRLKNRRSSRRYRKTRARLKAVGTPATALARPKAAQPVPAIYLAKATSAWWAAAASKAVAADLVLRVWDAAAKAMAQEVAASVQEKRSPVSRAHSAVIRSSRAIRSRPDGPVRKA